MNKRLLLLIVFMLGAVSPALAGDLELSLLETGKRDYYCTFTVGLSNQGDQTINSVNGFLLLSDGSTAIGKSYPASFLGIEPAASAEATFRIADAPCEDISQFTFVIGACRIENQFIDLPQCAAKFTAAPPIQAVQTR